MPTVEDARGRKLTLDSRPVRIVSLVPSLTETVAMMAGAKRLVGVTKFCTEPQEEIPRIRKVGGTKDPDIEAIVSLAPEIVLANREENRAEDVAALEAAGLRVFVGYPRSVREGVAEIRTLATLLQSGPVRRLAEPIETEIARQDSLNPERPRVRVFCPIWRGPYMAVAGDTYAGDVIRMAGGANVFEQHPRGNRYPQVDLAEIAAADPQVILLPSEPYRFNSRHRDEILTLQSISAAREGRVHLVDGRWLTWYGKRAAEGLAGLEALFDRARPEWDPPARPVVEKRGAAKNGVAGTTGTGATTKAGTKPARASTKKTAKKTSTKKSAAPKRAPKTETPLPPGLKLRVRSQEVVEE